MIDTHAHLDACGDAPDLVVVRARQAGVDRIVTVTYRIDPEKVTILVKDTGPGFDPARLPHAADAGDPTKHTMVREVLGLREGGFGIMIARGLVDELQYNEKGNEVRLIKFFPPNTKGT